jgi:hypothetical protein
VSHFGDRVMRTVAARPLPRRSWWRRLFVTRELRLRWTPALVAVGVVTIAVIAAVRRDAPAPESDALVRFALMAPDAHEVRLAGDFNGWQPATLSRGPDGVWVTQVPLRGGDWSYAFVVDGQWRADPLADTWRADGFGGKNAVVHVATRPGG